MKATYIYIIIGIFLFVINGQAQEGQSQDNQLVLSDDSQDLDIDDSTNVGEQTEDSFFEEDEDIVSTGEDEDSQEEIANLEEDEDEEPEIDFEVKNKYPEETIAKEIMTLGAADQPNSEAGEVIVEPMNAVRIDSKTKRIYMLSYKERRRKWGSTVNISAGKYASSDYNPDSVLLDFDTFYGDAESPMLEILTNIKRNFSFWSLGIEIGLAYASNSSDPSYAEAELNTTIVKLGARIALDGMFKGSQWFSPYIAGGAYSISYSEKQATSSFNGTTQAAGYATAGVAFAIDWLDPNSANLAYFESGIEQTSLFVEATQYINSSAEKDPNFTALSMNAGLSVEF